MYEAQHYHYTEPILLFILDASKTKHEPRRHDPIAFQLRKCLINCIPKGPPTYATPPESFLKVGLESSSTESSFPADCPKSAPLAVASLDGR